MHTVKAALQRGGWSIFCARVALNTRCCSMNVGAPCRLRCEHASAACARARSPATWCSTSSPPPPHRQPPPLTARAAMPTPPPLLRRPSPRQARSHSAFDCRKRRPRTRRSRSTRHELLFLQPAAADRVAAVRTCTPEYHAVTAPRRVPRPRPAEFNSATPATVHQRSFLLALWLQGILY